MTTERYERIPELTLGWRLKMSLVDSGTSREKIAQIMDVQPSTISRWMGDKGAPPKRPYLIQWSLATDVSLGWLETGQASTQPTPPDGGQESESQSLAELTSRKRDRTRTTAGGASTHR